MPGLESCPSGLLVIGILTLCSVHITSEILSNEVSDVQFGSLGSTVTLTCGGSHRGSPVQWTHNGKRMHSSDGSLILANTTHSMEGNYSCHGPTGEVLNSIRLSLGYFPGFLDVSCKVPSQYKMYCTWKQRVRTHLPTTYLASTSADGGRPELCKQERIDINECTISSPLFWVSEHLVNITEINPLGSKSTIKRVDIHKSLKPDAIEALSCEEVNGVPDQLLVKWEHPASWPPNHAFPLKFEVEYRPVGSYLWSKLETENTSVMIMDALAGHLHQIRVRAQDAFINHSQWSEWSQMVQVQPWTDPLVRPEEDIDDFYGMVFFPSTFPVKATEKSPDLPFDENGNRSLLITIGLLATFMVAVVSVITVLLCRMKNRRPSNVTKQELTAMVKMKSLPI